MIFNSCKNKYNHFGKGSILLVCGLLFGSHAVADPCEPSDNNCIDVIGEPIPSVEPDPWMDDGPIIVTNPGGGSNEEAPVFEDGGDNEETGEECDEFEDCMDLFGQTLADLMQESYYSTYHSYINSDGESSIALINTSGIVYLTLYYTNEGEVEAYSESTPFFEWIIGIEWNEGG